jgi:hypothetical protein
MKLNLNAVQGSTFDQTVFWETQPMVYRPISSVTLTGPVRLTAAGHGMLSGQRAAVVGVKGTTELNAQHVPFENDEYRVATVIDANTIEFNEEPGPPLTAYKSAGYIAYWTLKDLTAFTARMTIRDKIGGTALLALVSPTGLVLTTSIQILITAVQTAALAIGRWVYDLELVSASGVVTKLLNGTFNVAAEVTT